MQYQVLCHIHRNDSHFLAVFTDHLLNDAGEVIVLGLFDDVQQLLHHRLDEGSDVDLSCTHTIHKRQKERGKNYTSTGQADSRFDLKG